jgi:competence protein ComEC
MAAPEEENDRSLVVRLTLGESRVLLTGDAGEDLERALLQSRAPLSADVLKVAHHGSGSSTSAPFLAAVQPRFAIVSARERAGWPLPSANVLNRLREKQIPYARTDEHGSITVHLDEEGRLQVETYKGEERKGAMVQRRKGGS